MKLRGSTLLLALIFIVVISLILFLSIKLFGLTLNNLNATQRRFQLESYASSSLQLFPLQKSMIWEQNFQIPRRICNLV